MTERTRGRCVPPGDQIRTESHPRSGDRESLREGEDSEVRTPQPGKPRKRCQVPVSDGTLLRRTSHTTSGPTRLRETRLPSRKGPRLLSSESSGLPPPSLTSHGPTRPVQEPVVGPPRHTLLKSFLNYKQ